MNQTRSKKREQSHPKIGPRPGPSSQPPLVRDLPINLRHPDSRQSDPLLTKGERDRQAGSRQRNPLITRGEKNRQDSRQRSSFLTQGDNTKSMSQQHSVSGQMPEGQHICWEGSPDPTAIGDWTVGPSGHTYRLLERLQDRHKQGLHLCPREQDSDGDKPPSKITKSVQWMRSLLGRHLGEEREQIDKEKEGETRDRTPTMETEMEHGSDT